MNYGEEYALWYLRLNGFFPLSNFVIHKSDDIRYSSDCDLLAIRPPYVYEEVGGKPDDWDNWIIENFNTENYLGVICEVKTGSYDEEKLFKNENVKYCVGRLGFLPIDTIGNESKKLYTDRAVSINPNIQIAKILIAEDGATTAKYFFLPLKRVIEFIQERIARYPKEKYRDRMFFSSILLQSVIDRVALER